MRRLDPAKSNKSTVAMSARPGNTASHHMPAERYPIDSLRMTPMAGLLGRQAETEEGHGRLVQDGMGKQQHCP